MSNKAQVIHNLGPPNSMKWQDWPLSYPKVGEVRLRHTAIAVNFADTYHRAVPPSPGKSGQCCSRSAAQNTRPWCLPSHKNEIKDL